MSLELTDKEREYIKEFIATYFDTPGIGAIIYKLQAAKNKAEFWRDHTDYPDIDEDRVRGCDVCNWAEPYSLDPRHDYTDKQWLEAAKKELADTEEK